MALFRCEHCEDMRAQRDRAQHELSTLLSEQTALVKEVLAVKRHDLGMPPAGFSATDPLAALGKQTRAAIEEMSRGYPDQQTYLTNWALTEAVKAGAEGESGDELDRMLAHAIREGDPG